MQQNTQKTIYYSPARVCHLWNSTEKKNSNYIFFSVKNKSLFILDDKSRKSETTGLISLSKEEFEEKYTNIFSQIKMNNIDEIYVAYFEKISLSFLLHLGIEWQLVISK